MRRPPWEGMLLLRRLLPALLPLILLGCDEWPRFANLDSGPEPYPADADPRAMVSIDWKKQTGTQGADDPTKSPLWGPAVNEGYYYEGILQGSGWNKKDEMAPIRCDGLQFIPLVGEGAYMYQAHYFRTQPRENTTLCVDIAFSDEVPDDYGFDLFVFPAAECGVPLDGPIENPDNGLPLGYGATGRVAGWSLSNDRYYAILLGSYRVSKDRDNENFEAPYRIGVSFVTAGPDGHPAPCPYLLDSYEEERP